MCTRELRNVRVFIPNQNPTQYRTELKLKTEAFLFFKTEKIKLKLKTKTPPKVKHTKIN